MSTPTMNNTPRRRAPEAWPPEQLSLQRSAHEQVPPRCGIPAPPPEYPGSPASSASSWSSSRLARNFDFDPIPEFRRMILECLVFYLILISLVLGVIIFALWLLVTNCRTPPRELAWSSDNKTYSLPDFGSLHAIEKEWAGVAELSVQGVTISAQLERGDAVLGDFIAAVTANSHASG